MHAVTIVFLALALRTFFSNLVSKLTKTKMHVFSHFVQQAAGFYIDGLNSMETDWSLKISYPRESILTGFILTKHDSNRNYERNQNCTLTAIVTYTILCTISL